MGERANQSGNFSTRIEAAEFRKRFFVSEEERDLFRNETGKKRDNCRV